MKKDFFVFAFDTISPRGGMNDFKFKASSIEEIKQNITQGDEWSEFRIGDEEFNHIQVTKLETGEFIQISRYEDLDQVVAFLKSMRLIINLESNYQAKMWGKLHFGKDLVTTAGDSEQEVLSNMRKRLLSLRLVSDEEVDLIEFTIDPSRR
ncbi:hypothetical protein [Telluribacter sp. SYSU D00476]|uniref:hypothetical protein n=1 Tax=Telluribacter sp. SYSU D00476 TaxID=2811430 RepID=UPI001FF2A3AB|nr:hypothetical protein [Telluribacter sp. SYSU D00476]